MLHWLLIWFDFIQVLSWDCQQPPSIKFNSLFHFTQSNTIFTLYQVIYIINKLYRRSCCFHLYCSWLSFSIICMFCGNREGISNLPCSILDACPTPGVHVGMNVGPAWCEKFQRGSFQFNLKKHFRKTARRLTHLLSSFEASCLTTIFTSVCVGDLSSSWSLTNPWRMSRKLLLHCYKLSTWLLLLRKNRSPWIHN